MKIQILKYLEGAKKATGTAVLFDVFRASNTILACLVRGASYLIPVGDLQSAYTLKRENPDYLLFGERGGIPPEGFDADNSPWKAFQFDLKDKSVILTTSAGSQGIVNACQVQELLIGSFGNAEALVKYIRAKNPKEVSLIAIGENASQPAIEDEECAKFIKNSLLGINTDFEEIVEKILQGEGAKRLKRLHQQKDLEFCTELDWIPIVPFYNKEKNCILY